MPKRKIVGYQITNKNCDVPDGLWSFQIFKTAEQAYKYAREHLTHEKYFFVQQIREGDIEEPTYIDEV